MKIIEWSTRNLRSLLLAAGVALLVSGCNICGGPVEKKSNLQTNASGALATVDASNGR
jgi:heterodisulfide reductase subunit B